MVYSVWIAKRCACADQPCIIWSFIFLVAVFQKERNLKEQLNTVDAVLVILHYSWQDDRGNAKHLLRSSVPCIVIPVTTEYNQINGIVENAQDLCVKEYNVV